MQNVRLLEDLLSRGAQRAKTILLLISTDEKHHTKHGLCIALTVSSRVQGIVAVIQGTITVYPWKN